MRESKELECWSRSGRTGCINRCPGYVGPSGVREVQAALEGSVASIGVVWEAGPSGTTEVQAALGGSVASIGVVQEAGPSGGSLLWSCLG